MLNIFADALLIAAGFGTFPADGSSRTSTQEIAFRFPKKSAPVDKNSGPGKR